MVKRPPDDEDAPQMTPSAWPHWSAAPPPHHHHHHHPSTSEGDPLHLHHQGQVGSQPDGEFPPGDVHATESEAALGPAWAAAGEARARLTFNPKSRVCPLCGKWFDRREYFQDHLNMHNNVKAHRCSHCSRTFTYKRNLWQHERYGVCLKQKNT